MAGGAALWERQLTSAAATSSNTASEIPLAGEQRVDPRVAPLALRPQVLDVVRLAAHAEPLHEPCRGRVARIAVAEQAVHAERAEREIDHRAGGFGRDAAAMLGRREHAPQLAGAQLVPAALETAAAEQAIVAAPRDREVVHH